MMPLRWMLFVDGENLAIRGKVVLQKYNLELRPGPYYEEDVYLWLPYRQGFWPQPIWQNIPHGVSEMGVRAFYYTSVVGDPARIEAVRKSIWSMGFTPQVFKRRDKNRKAKGVDIALTKDMLSNAFQDNYDIAILVAADGDYVPLVEEVKRLGKIVYLGFFDDSSAGISEDLRLSADGYVSINPYFIDYWQKYRENGFK